jgi:hypothetical protein
VSEDTPVRDELGNDPLADARLRLRWANDDGQAFGELSNGLASPGAYAVHVQRKGDWWQATWHRFIDPRVEAETFAELTRRLGSFLDHTRAVLNYSTYQLALHAIRQDPALEGDLIPDAVEFPIFCDPKLFKRQNRVKKLPQEHRDAIEAVQPYDGRNPGLWMLHELAREYRHRVLHATAILPAEDVYHVLVNGQLTEPTDMEIIPHERLEHGDVVMRFRLPDIDPDAYVHPQVAITVGIDHILCRELIGVSVLNEIRNGTEVALGAIEPLILPA